MVNEFGKLKSRYKSRAYVFQVDLIVKCVMTEYFYTTKLFAFLTCVVRISTFFPPSSNSPEANLQNKSCKIIDLFTTHLAHRGFKV